MRRRLLKYSIYLSICILFLVVCITILNKSIKERTQSKIYSSVQNLPERHTVIVLGASVQANGNLSTILRDRVESALQLYIEGKVKRFLLSGDNGSKYYNEPKAMKAYLLERGVPEDHIYLDYAGFDTYDTIYRSRDVFQVTDAIIVTQRFHLPRALYIAQSLNMDYIGYTGDKRTYQYEDHNIRRELLANVKAFIELTVKQKPTYLGQKIPINGPPQSSYEN